MAKVLFHEPEPVGIEEPDGSEVPPDDPALAPAVPLMEDMLVAVLFQDP